MSNNTMSIAVGTALVVVAANTIEQAPKRDYLKQILGSAVYVFILAAMNEFAPEVASKLALLVLVGVLLTRGVVVLNKLKEL